MNPIIETRTKITEKPGYTCPSCGGAGHYCDGMFSFGTVNGEMVTQTRAPTTCGLCNGKGRVNVTAIPD